ncbi:MAG TPA: hypothetical protein VMS09_08090 [Paenibacillus sp.]|uniref:hypothetical protein n=1 Tax=Paenibacillus sp. TaxID=58172 RepID=UPI002C61DD88|nr:hypothetical protein [Paenibacillus sp.]HUC91974.1 hypothetical protein [Paenibacillus sp.]
MRKRYECKLETEGYRLNVTVFAENESTVERLALRRAAELFRQTFGKEKKTSDFVVVSVKEK